MNRQLALVLFPASLLLVAVSLGLSHEAAASAEAAAALPPTNLPLPGNGHDVMESAFCAGCHPAIYAEHEQSTHGRAFTDEEVRLATARFSLRDCIVCHTPRPIFETGVGLNPRRRHHGLEEGITCMSCHWQPDHDYTDFQGGDECRSAFHPDTGRVEACASCHRNHGTPFQWEKSPTGRVTGRECMDCHMEEVERPIAVGGEVRFVRSHVFPGSRDESQLRRAYTYASEIRGDSVLVTIENSGTGHNFPTELKQRSLESLIVVRDLAGAVVARSRRVFRDPYKRPYGLELPVNTQIPGGQSRVHRVPLPVAAGTVETTLFFKRYFPIDDFHPDLARVLESRSLPFADVTPSLEEVESAPEVVPVTPEGIAPEVSSVANLVDYARPPIGTVEVDVPLGDSPEEIEQLIGLFQFPVPQANTEARRRLAGIGTPAVPALIAALGSWDNKTYNQALAVLEEIGEPARPAVVAALESDALYVRIHARKLLTRMLWRGPAEEAALRGALSAHAALDRASAAHAAGVLGLETLADTLRPLLRDADPDVVREAALALALLGAQAAAPEIEAALERAHYAETRRDLATALARLGSPAGVPVLLAGLDHPDDLIRESFFEALFAVTGEHRGYEVFAPRPERLEAIARLTSWWAVAGGPGALVRPNPGRDPFAEAYARKLVSKLGGNDLETSGTEQDLVLVQDLVTLGPHAVPALVQGLKVPAGFAAKRALIGRCLGQIADPRSAPALAATLRDPVVAVAAWAAWALERVGDPATEPALARYEQRLRTLIAREAVPAPAGPPDRLLAQVARARYAVGNQAARHTLVTLLLSEDEFARRAAFEALAGSTGEDRGYDPAGTAEERRRAAARWAE